MKKSIINAINSISNTAELNEAITLIKQKQKQIRSEAASSIKSKLQIGNNVRVVSKQVPTGEVGKLISIARTKATVEINGLRYKCSLSMLAPLK